MQPNKLKILMIGPSESGKTRIANFISDSINIEEAEAPRPTQGVRIVEFELPNLNINGKTTSIDIELWDCSGDHRFESCWPALRVGVQGVILVCSPNTAQAAAREMELLYNYFVSQPKLSAKQCVLFYNCTDDQDEMDSLNLSLISWSERTTLRLAACDSGYTIHSPLTHTATEQNTDVYETIMCPVGTVYHVIFKKPKLDVEIYEDNQNGK